MTADLEAVWEEEIERLRKLLALCRERIAHLNAPTPFLERSHENHPEPDRCLRCRLDLEIGAP